MIGIQIHEESCRSCSLCVDICPTFVFEMSDGTGKAVVTKAEDCVGCLSCAYVCPANAITHTDYSAVKNFFRDLDFSSRVARFL